MNDYSKMYTVKGENGVKRRVIVRPRIRVLSTNRKMNNHHPQHQQKAPPPQQQNMGRVPKSEAYQQQQQQQVPIRMRAPATYIQQPPQQQQQRQQVMNGARVAGSATTNQRQQNYNQQQAVTIEEVPNAQQAFENSNSSSGAQPRVDEEKLPLFLIKLWNIVQDPAIQSIIHWDESGASFHIDDPFSFCRNVLPHYFKHNNLNSLIRQLNMYGFRKMTPLSQGGLTRTESDQDHLEFSHPYFVQSHPEYMINIKRKQSTRADEKQMTVQTQNNMELLMSEVRGLRDKQRSMEARMSTLNKENRQLWDQMSTMRHQHTRQQQVVKKLFQFLVSMLQPSLPNRNLKRGVLAIDGHVGPSNSKRPRQEGGDKGASNTNGLNSSQLSEMLESLQRELQDGEYVTRFSNDQGPVIAEVTDEIGHSPTTSQPYGTNFDDFADEPDYEEMVSPAFLAGANNSSNSPLNRRPVNVQENPANVYMGSGALTAENVARRGNAPAENGSINRKQPKRSASRQQTNYQQNNVPYQPPTYQQNQITYDYPETQQQNNQLVQVSTPKKPEDDNLNAMNYDRQDAFSPTLVMSPSLERQISQEIQDYLNGVDFTIDNCRDLLTDWADFDQPNGDLMDYGKYGEPSTSTANGERQRLALEHIPLSEDGEKQPSSSMQPSSLSVPTSQNGSFSAFDQSFQDPVFPNIPDQMNLDQFPGTPELLTPGSSPSRAE